VAPAAAYLKTLLNLFSDMPSWTPVRSASSWTAPSWSEEAWPDSCRRWNEWSLGRGSGPSSQQLDSAWGAKWRDPTEKQFYHRRLSIIKAIQRRHESGQASSLQEGAVQLEALRTGVHEGMSLNKFNKVLRGVAAGATG